MKTESRVKKKINTPPENSLDGNTSAKEKSHRAKISSVFTVRSNSATSTKTKKPLIEGKTLTAEGYKNR